MDLDRKLELFDQAVRSICEHDDAADELAARAVDAMRDRLAQHVKAMVKRRAKAKEGQKAA